MSSTTPHPPVPPRDTDDSEFPQINALFLVRFDKKVGYTISWKRTRHPIPLDNAVEYKSLPSGLHSVESDLVYFVHEGYAGVSAFARGDGDAAERNANFVAVAAGGVVEEEDIVCGESAGSDDVLSARDAELLIPGTESLLRLPTLFSVGVHDIPTLEGPKHGGHTPGDEEAEGWVACTTDEIIATKSKLYDILVELPSTQSTPSHQRRWPKLRTSDGSIIKASQRDVSRYKLLHKELFKHRNTSLLTTTATLDPPYTDADTDTHSTAPLLSRDEIDAKRADDDYTQTHDDTIVEPMTWTRLAYRGFLWWASSGSRDDATPLPSHHRDLIIDPNLHSLETSVIAYFHRQTAQLVARVASVVDEGGGGAGEGEVVVVDGGEVEEMGLDVWSEGDRAFVDEFANVVWWECSYTIKSSASDSPGPKSDVGCVDAELVMGLCGMPRSRANRSQVRFSPAVVIC
ncbi:hypothetical protein GQ44DRAFT_785606 [Phaeosphaeriaceae sp. PMI808]|nr:hypothetical protein GQ44DRAFT_785606 [Phaeosphaeriaceae sp. PMI808]